MDKDTLVRYEEMLAHVRAAQNIIEELCKSGKVDQNEWYLFGDLLEAGDCIAATINEEKTGHRTPIRTRG